MSLASLFRKVVKAAKSPEGRAVIAVAKIAVPLIVAPKIVAKGADAYAKAKVAREVVRGVE